MKIAVTYENGDVFGHFGHTKQFKIYEIEGSKIISSDIIDTNGSGHGALAGFLAANKIDALICGGIGGGAKSALSEYGITIYGGITGNADVAVMDFILGNLKYNPNVRCSHHDHEHGDNEHTCESHGCGKDSCH